MCHRLTQTDEDSHAFLDLLLLNSLLDLALVYSFTSKHCIVHYKKEDNNSTMLNLAD